MFQKLVLTIIFSFFFISMNAQDEKAVQRVKYITKAPDGTTSMVIFDDSRNNTIELAAKTDFYKYQLIDLNTGEPAYTFDHKGKNAVLHKSKVVPGNYELRIYTKQFVVTSFITIAHKDYFLQSEEIIAASGN